jgi:hypothetical protein
MKISIELYKSDGCNSNSEYPIKVIYDKSENNKRVLRRFSIPFTSKTEDWNNTTKEPYKSHPSYSIFFPYLMRLKLRISEVLTSEDLNFEAAKKMILRQGSQEQPEIISFGRELAKEKTGSTAESYETALNVFTEFIPSVYYADFNYKLLVEFKNSQIGRKYNIKLDEKGNEISSNVLTKSTVDTYLRRLRAIYNEFCRRNELSNKKPFETLFNGLKTRSAKSKKNYLTNNQLRKFRAAEFSGNMKLAQQLWLLQFYLGGQDLKDIVFLKNSDIVKGRVFFRRKKLAGGYFLNNKIFPEAQEIIDELSGSDSVYLFDFRKDEKGYKTFRRRIQKDLVLAQSKLKLKLPEGVSLGIKTARHTFANIGKRLFVDSDLLRELMGHERKGIDNYYKDEYPEKVRDKFHKKIINKSIKKAERHL